MKAIVLTAGMGRRMRPLTDHVHKTLLPIADTTILQRILSSLEDHGIVDVCIVTGHRANDIRSFVAAEFGHLNVDYVHNADFETTNNVYSMALALEHTRIDDDILLIESDLIFDPKVLTQLVSSPHENAALVDRYRPGLDGTVVSLAADGSIGQVYPSYMQGGDFSFADKYKTLNIYRFSEAFCRTSFRRLLSFYSRAIDDSCYYELLLGVLIYLRATTVHAVMVEHPWAEVDDPNDLLSAEFTFNPPARLDLAERAWGGYWALPHLDFAFIRNMYFPTPAVVAELRNNLEALLVNYGSAQATLNRKLAYVERCDERHVVVLNGASQAFPTLRRLFAGRTVLRPEPTFGEYEHAFPGAQTYRDHGGIDWDEVLERSLHSEVLVIVNPNNPTGTVVPTADICALAAARPNLTIIVDESFLDFSDQRSIVGPVESAGLANVVTLKSLSKVLGVPGLRLGYLHTLAEEVRAALDDDVPIWNVNSVAEHFLEVILKHRAPLLESFTRTKADRETFARALEQVLVVDRVFPSGANFLLVRLHLDAGTTHSLLERLMSQHLVHVKDVSPKFDDGRGYLRLAVRTPADNELVCRLLNAPEGCGR
jgi:histidinol-phosphate/aromatic aminotransferase/cobyric acid decarboxylase-like protein/choline kinase